MLIAFVHALANASKVRPQLWRKLLPLAGALALAATAPAQATLPVQENTPPVAAQRLQPGDLIAVNVTGAPELSTEARLAANGTFTMPEAGAVALAGDTAAQAGRKLAARLQQTYLLDPQVQVLVKQFAPEPVTVGGAVRSPGVYSARTYPELGAMLAAAGGIRSAAGDAVLVRSPGGGVDVKIPVAALARGGDAATLPLRAGDMVQVLPAGQVYVAGDVVKPGAYPLPSSGLTLLEALALAGGARHDSLTSHTRIVRRLPDGTLHTSWVNTDRVRRAQAADPSLQPSDLVYIPYSPGKSGLAAGFQLAATTVAQIIAGVIIFHWTPRFETTSATTPTCTIGPDGKLVCH